MHRRLPVFVITLFTVLLSIGCANSEPDAIVALPVLAIAQRRDDVSSFLDRNLPPRERLDAADRCQIEKEQIDLILKHVPEFLAIAQSGDEPQPIRCRAMQLLTTCAHAYPREGCESAILSVVNDDSASRAVRASGAALLFQLPSANWDIDFLLDIILHNSVPEKWQEDAIGEAIPLFLADPGKGYGLFQRLLKIATTNGMHPSVRRATLIGMQFHGVPWITQNDEWQVLRRLGDAAMSLLLDKEHDGAVRQAAVGVASTVIVFAPEQAAHGWEDRVKEYVKVLSLIVVDDVESADMRATAATECGSLGKSATKELVPTFENGLFTGGPVTQRYVMDAVAGCGHSRELWLPIIDRYIEDDTRDLDVRKRAAAVRRTIGIKSI